MGIIEIFLLALFVITSLVLVLLVLIQDEQREGLGGIFGGGSSTPFGSRSGNVLTKFTSILGALFIVFAFGLAWLNKTAESGDVVGAARRGTAVEQSTDWWNATESDQSTESSEEGAKQTDDAETQ